MSVDLTIESPLSLRQAAAMLPAGRRDRPVTLSCVLRWVLDGVKAPNGTVVRLEAVRVGGRWLTSREALQRFAARLTPQLESGATPPRTPGQRRRASERAARDLDSAGI